MSEFGSYRGQERFHHHHHHHAFLPIPPWQTDGGDFGPPAPVAPMADMDDSDAIRPCPVFVYLVKTTPTIRRSRRTTIREVKEAYSTPLRKWRRAFQTPSCLRLLPLSPSRTRRTHLTIAIVGIHTITPKRSTSTRALTRAIGAGTLSRGDGLAVTSKTAIGASWPSVRGTFTETSVPRWNSCTKRARARLEFGRTPLKTS